MQAFASWGACMHADVGVGIDVASDVWVQISKGALFQVSSKLCDRHMPFQANASTLKHKE